MVTQRARPGSKWLLVHCVVSVVLLSSSLVHAAAHSTFVSRAAPQHNKNATSEKAKAASTSLSRGTATTSAAAAAAVASGVGEVADDGEPQLAAAVARSKRSSSHVASSSSGSSKHSRRAKARASYHSRDNAGQLSSVPGATLGVAGHADSSTQLPSVPKFAQGNQGPEVVSGASLVKGPRPLPAASYVYSKNQQVATPPLLPAGRKHRHHEGHSSREPETPNNPQQTHQEEAEQPAPGSTHTAPHHDDAEAESEQQSKQYTAVRVNSDTSDLPKSQGRVHEATAELQIEYTGDEKGTGTMDLDGGLIWTVSADSGRSSSLNKLQADGSYGAWSLHVTQVYKWAKVPGVRPYVALEGASSQPKSVTIKGRLGGVTAGPKHQTQLTSAITAASGGSVPRSFTENTRVYLDQPHTCSYKWTSSESDQTVECRGKLVSATPTLAFDGKLRDFLDAGMYQDLPFMDNVEVTCQIEVCTPSDEL